MFQDENEIKTFQIYKRLNLFITHTMGNVKEVIQAEKVLTDGNVDVHNYEQPTLIRADVPLASC